MSDLHRLRRRFIVLASIPAGLGWLLFGATTTVHAQGLTEFLCLPGAIQVTAETFTATEGVAFTGEVATWTEPAQNAGIAASASASSSAAAPVYKALITWESGKTDLVSTTGTSHDDGSVTGTVSGTHTYAEEHATQAFQVRVGKLVDNEPVKTGCSQAAANVANAALTVTQTFNQSTSENGIIDAEILAKFSDANGTPDAQDFSASINWADNTPADTDTSIGGNKTDGFTVTGSHSYHEGGTYTVTVTITDNKLGVGNQKASVTGTLTATVTDPALHATNGAGATSTEGSSTGTITLATFTDSSDNEEPITTYSATVDWKDGSTSTCSSVSTTCPITFNDSTGKMEIKSSHTYVEDGTYAVRVTIKDNGGATATADDTIKVNDAALTASNGPAFNAQQNQSSGNVVTATFTDANPNKDKTDFTATIDWGDGKTSAGTVNLGEGTYSVTGSHTYTSTGSFTVKTSIADKGSSTASATAAASVAAPPTLATTGQSSLIPPGASSYVFLAGLLLVLGVLGYWALLRDRFVWSSKRLR